MRSFPCRAWRALGLLWLFSLGVRTEAGIQPSFSLESSAWNATDIAVMTEGDRIDGVLTVLDTWKGALKPGQRMTVPELAALAPAKARTVAAFSGAGGQAHSLTGHRIVLFLRRGRAKNGGPAWLAANRWPFLGDWHFPINVSAAWVERGQVYDFVQTINPGPTRPVFGNMTEAQLQAQTRRILATKGALYRVIALPDKARRAQALAPFTRSPLYLARDAAWRALGACGGEAVPTLKTMLHAAHFPAQYAQIVGALTQAQGKNAGPYLTRVVREETAFWARHGQDMPADWWELEGSPAAHRRKRDPGGLLAHYDKAYVALDALRNLHYTGGAGAVRAYRDWWGAHPPHHDRTGLYEMRRACADILDAPLR